MTETHRLKFFAPLLLLAALALTCEPSPYIYHEHVVYNFSSEGFLAPDLLQTVGVAPLDREREQAPGSARSACVKNATRAARRRALRVLLHTHFNLPGSREEQAASQAGDLERDYPFPLTERDLIRGEIEFAGLLERGYIALQDLRAARECTIVFRIKGRDLPGEIRSTPVDFEPEGMRGGYRLK